MVTRPSPPIIESILDIVETKLPSDQYTGTARPSAAASHSTVCMTCGWLPKIAVAPSSMKRCAHSR